MTAEEDFARATRRGRCTRLYALVAVLAAPFAYLGYRIWHGNRVNDAHREEVRREMIATPDQIAETKTSLPQLAAKLAAASAAIKADVTAEAVTAALAATDASKACPYDLAREFGLDDLARDLNLLDHRPPVALVEHLPLAIDGLAGARGHLADATTALAADALTKDLAASVRQDAHDLGGALFVIGTASKAVTAAGSFVPGRVDGTAVLYLFRDRRIACIAPLAVRTPDAVVVKYSAPGPNQDTADRAADDQLERALYEAEVDALRHQLLRVPRLPP